MRVFASLSTELRQYLIITGNYWSFTLTDGALRMLVVLHFHQLGFSALEIAMLFLFYEFFGVITNLIGGWLGARLGLNITMNVGLMLQIVALSMLLLPSTSLTVSWVMAAQALSGIAKDLNKMSAKSAIKTLIPEDQQKTLFKWVAFLTGSKNALKGVGFFIGGILLSWLGFHNAILVMTCGLAVVWLFSMLTLQNNVGKSLNKPKFTEVFSKSKHINTLSAARLFLFGARDIWFVVALPVYFTNTLGWQHWEVGSFFAVWVIVYGFVQSQAPNITNRSPSGRTILSWCVSLVFTMSLIAIAVYSEIYIEIVIVSGLILFGALFAINSSLHSFMIVHYASAENTSMDVGFYYMANAMGRLIGTVLSGVLFQQYGLTACLTASTLFLTASAIISTQLPANRAISEP